MCCVVFILLCAFIYVFSVETRLYDYVECLSMPMSFVELFKLSDVDTCVGTRYSRVCCLVDSVRSRMCCFVGRWVRVPRILQKVGWRVRLESCASVACQVRVLCVC
jgi:hypothetical protein